MRKFRGTKEPIDINDVKLTMQYWKKWSINDYDGYVKYSNNNIKSLLIDFSK